MISTVSLSFDLTYTNPVTGALQPRGIVVDSTDYAGLGIDLLNTGAKGYGVVTFNGDIIVDLDTVLTPMIDLQNWATLYPGVTPNYVFDLPLDLNGNVANGVYTFEYSLHLDPSVAFAIVDTPDVNTLVVNGTNAWLVDFLEAGDEITIYGGGGPSQNIQIGSIVFTDPNITITTPDTIASLSNTSFIFDLTKIQLSKVYTYAGCTQTSADVSFTYDCEVGDNGTWAVSNTTSLASNEVVASLNCTINYPSWATLSPTFPGNVVVTSLPYPSAPGTETPLATGTYTVSLTEQIQQTQTDGLIFLYSTSVIKEFVVSCAGTLCGLVPCIENLRAAHQAELVRNRISKYQVFVDNVLMYYIEALNYKACGELTKYKETIALLQSQLDASGCDCACCDDQTYYWVSNNSGVSVIESLIQSFQFQLFNGIPGVDQDITQGVQIGALWEDVNTGILYINTSNIAGAATWEEYYAPGVAPTASEVPATPSPNFLTANNVQGQLDQVEALAIFDAENGLTKLGNAVRLGGTLDDDTTIDVNGNDFIIQSDDSTLEVIATAGVPLLLDVNQNSSGVGLNLLLQTTNTAGVGANGIGSSIQFAAENGAGATSTTSTIKSTWVNAASSSSNFQITTKKNNVESPAFTVNFNGSITLDKYGQTPALFPGSPLYFLGVDGSGLVQEAALPVYTMAVIRITQASTGAPTLVQTVFNNTGGTFTFDYSGVGQYKINLSGGLITTTKTSVLVTNGSTGSRRGFVYAVPFAGYVGVTTYDDSGLANNDIITNATVEIKIFA